MFCQARLLVACELSSQSEKRTVRQSLHKSDAGYSLLTYLYVGDVLSEENSKPILDLLIQTYPLYVDRNSRLAVQQCLRTILKSITERDTKYLAARLQKECAKPSLSAASAFVLVEWCCILLQHLSNIEAPIGAVLDVISANANVLELCLGETSRPTVRQSALRITRRALRAIFTSRSLGEDAIRESVSKLTTGTSAQKNAPFIGVISGVCARLAARKDVLAGLKKSILVFYTKEILGSRSQVPPHIANGLSDFLHHSSPMTMFWPISSQR